MAVLLIWYRLKVIHALIVTIAALVATWVVSAYVVATRPTAEDIDTATAPIKAELKSEKQRADNTQLQLGQLQIQLETAEERLTKANAQLGPRSPILRLDDARRWQIVKSMIEAMPEATQQGCSVDVAYE
jgi:Tfp pilus assembly protein PilO